MLNHHIQKAIIYRLAIMSPLRFSELKPPDLDNKLFSYHLRIVMGLGLVAKNNQGHYILTAHGKTLGVHVYSEMTDLYQRARPEILLAVRSASSWLVYKRHTDPLRNYVGFMHCEPRPEFDVCGRASLHLKDTCGLEVAFQVAGSGIISTYTHDELESYINFTLVYGKSDFDELTISDPHAEYFWLNDELLSEQLLLPSMPDILSGLKSKQHFFIDTTYQL